MDENLTIDVALTKIANLYKWIYFQSMVTEQGQTVERLKNSQHRFLEQIVDKLHIKYHQDIENMKKQIDLP
jgi:hypothetical protein